MSIAAQIFACLAVPATLILLIQTILMFIGFGQDADGFDGGSDTPESDIPEADEIDPDVTGLDGLRIFSVRGIVAFFVVFGWVGVVMDAAGAHLLLTVFVSFVCGFAMMLAMAFLFRAVMRLRNDGNTDNRNAIGTAGKVQLTIPPSRTGEGKVHLMLQGSYVERNAVTDESEAIPTGYEVVVVGVSGQTDLVVKRK